MNRSQDIIRTSWIGIVANVLLAGFKAVVGALSSSVAIMICWEPAFLQNSPTKSKRKCLASKACTACST